MLIEEKNIVKLYQIAIYLKSFFLQQNYCFAKLKILEFYNLS